MNRISIFIILATLLFTSCKKESKAPVTSAKLKITSLWPDNGQAAMIVTINGKNFSSNPAANIVKFNGVDAVVIEASATQLQVVSPSNAGNGKVTITLNGQSAEGPVFTYKAAPASEYIVSTFAGDGTAGLFNGAAADAQFRNPEGLAVDAQGNVIVADRQNHTIRKISPAGQVTTIAGDGTAGYADGTGTAAKFSSPWKLAIDPLGNIIVADRDNFKIRKIAPDGAVTTLAGSTAGFADGTGSAAKFMQPLDVVADAQGNIYVADNTAHRIRKVSPSGTVTTLAGDGTAGYLDATGVQAKFRNPSGLTVDQQGNIIVADRLNHRIRKITPAGTVSTIAGAGTTGLLDGDALTAKFADPYGVAVDAGGNILVAELTNARIRKITPVGQVSTLAGSSAGFADGLSVNAKFNQPTDLDIDAKGNIYVAEVTNHRIRMIRLIK
ncbi:IPT/TIG domain-containing protein [Pedobacter heparinus]|uniref:NHL repeat containing protein n=1 Tax=Pedobacter heparinus (strain ATCC 13125 / DSM 2366 / CIP 104194 / JCM 7457 / NBRC 12017 / NCIMB 9290 / NRRL B-14731 / HIM 762-3) TaxID=485917 RepID=C6XT13_PEDHD|nr:IPT/TIG domain-containing protein [Pedobacter heparinus]ACU03574.1 NHL repeat containing protein [Pedobacter heparinus DSM 2366]